ncbi:MAG: PAS domain S-box protein [Pseudomonadota bacterium]
MTKEQSKTKQVLIQDLASLRKKITELEQAESERKRAESALRKSEAEKTIILESVSDMIFCIDTDMRVIYSNHAIENFFNLPSGCLEGKICYHVLHHRDEPCRACPALKAMESGKPLEIYISSLGRHWRLSGYPVRDESGAIVGAIEAVSDITDLRNAEEKYRSIFDNAMEGIYQSTLDGRIISANPALAKMFGYDSPEFMMSEVTSVGRSLYVDPDGRQAFLCLLEKQGIVKNFEFEGSKRDGDRIFISDSARAVKDSKGNTLYYEGIIQDITERKRAEEEKKRIEEQLKQAQKLEAIGTLAGGIAHDFNNLLMGIQGYASLMLLNMDASHPHYERLKRIEEQVQSGAGLTKQLLGFARIGRYEARPMNINDIIARTVSMFGRTKKEIVVHRSLAEDLWTVEADRGQMEQVFMNLYVNAWQAMPEGGELYLETNNVLLGDDPVMSDTIKPGRYVRISITDTGTGMDAKTRERIFDPFFTTKTMGRGTGLGLAMVYGSIKGHGGRIDVTSEPGKGTIFNIYLPASEKAIVKELAAATKILKGSETILLVDDEQMVLDVARELLKSLGYRVYSAGSGQEAIAISREKQKEIDLVVLDMIMPGLSGGDTFDRLREIDPEIRVLLSSGYSLDGQAQQILERGCNGFLQKPFRLENLSQKVREVLSE